MVCVAWVQERTKNGQEGTFWGDGGVLWFGAIVIRVYELSKLIEPKTCALLFILLITLLLLNYYLLLNYTSTKYICFCIFSKPCVIGTEVLPSFQTRELGRERSVDLLSDTQFVAKAGWSGLTVHTLARRPHLVPWPGSSLSWTLSFR